jgi:HSP20 family protein
MNQLIRWSPFNDLLAIHDQMDRLFSDSRGRHAGPTGSVPMDVWQDDREIKVRVAVPGFSPEDVEITIDDQGVLAVKGESKTETETENKNGGYLLKETSFGSFERRVVLPVAVDAEKAIAEFKDGVLEISVPKALPVAPKPVQIKVAKK